MRSNRWTLPVAALVLGAMLPGCATTEEKPAPAPLARMSAGERDEGARKVAEDYMANFAAAFRDRDIEKFKRVISRERQKQLTPEKFQEILNASQREQGELIDMELIGVLDQIIYQSYLWKLTYEKKDSEGKPIRLSLFRQHRQGRRQRVRHRRLGIPSLKEISHRRDQFHKKGEKIMKTLTEKQKNILEFIEEFLDREGMAPTVYEIAAHFDIKTSTVFAHLRALQRKKQLSRSSKARSISLINRPNSRNKVPQGALLIPLLGRVNAGAPAESLEYKEGEVCISSTLAPDCPPENLFALRVQGESMRDLGIYEGDIVIVAQTAVKPRSGDIVVALLQGGEVTVKSFFPKTQGRIELRPANPEYNVQIYPASEVSIQGRVIELRRKY